LDTATITEANILIDLSVAMKQRYRTNVTVIPFSRTEDFVNILTAGPIVIFRFSKPHSYSSAKKVNFTKFIFETKEHEALLRSFGPNQAFYIFVALNRFSEILSNRKDFMKYCIALDIHKVPRNISLNQRTRVIRMVKSSLTPKLEIAGEKRFEPIPQIVTLEELCNQFIRGVAGIIARPGSVPKERFVENFKGVTHHTFALHLGTESAAAS
jgi:hypothetical protein